jgi:hypothetical protein
MDRKILSDIHRGRRRTSRCSGSGRRRGIGVESRRRLGGAQTAERQSVRQTKVFVKTLHFAVILLQAVLCACATAKVGNMQASPPNDRFCDRDADCTIITHELHDCCPKCPGPASAVSRLAVKRHASHRRAECRGGCYAIAYACDSCRYDLREFTAVCVRQTCEIRGTKPGDSPKLICPVEPPSEPIFPGWCDPDPYPEACP